MARSPLVFRFQLRDVRERPARRSQVAYRLVGSQVLRGNTISFQQCFEVIFKLRNARTVNIQLRCPTSVIGTVVDKKQTNKYISTCVLRSQTLSNHYYLCSAKFSEKEKLVSVGTKGPHNI